MADDDRCPDRGDGRRADAPVPPDDTLVAGTGADAGPSSEATEIEPEATGPGATGVWGGVSTLPHERVGGAAGLPSGARLRYFGDYEIRAVLGRGGMGVVYEARQISLNRAVALKMIRAGLMAGDDELRRFRNEAEAIALLDHRGVVPVYEVGEHDGQRYFSMKLVSGGSLVPLLDRYKADPKAAALLVAEAAEAVAHAHMRGILHRDLKPANILVDDEGRPHVTDFGLAKRVEADVELTQSGAILGTPAYMAPEQASGRRGGITTATDVYGLGSVLYALLTGKAPFGGDSVAETLDAVRNRPPEPPTRLNDRVPPDLETICLKSLEKDPRRRYPTAQAMAADLHAWLGSRPISARRVGAAERAWLWSRREPAVAALAAGVVLALVGGMAAAIAVQAGANRALAAKNGDLTASLVREAEANAGLATANRRVEQRYDLAVDAIRTFHTGVSGDFLLDQDQFHGLRDRLLTSAGDFYGKLGALLGEETDPASRRALAQAQFEVADLTAKVGRSEAALAAHRRALATREVIDAGPGADAGTKADVGRSLTAVASLLEATARPVEAVATYRQAEGLLAAPAGSATAAESTRAALADCRSRLGYLLHKTGHAAEALSVLRKARDDQEVIAGAAGTTEVRLHLGSTVSRIAILLGETGKPSEAEAEFREGLAIHRELAEAHPAVSQFRRDLAAAHYNLAFLLSEAGKPSEAEAEFRAALAINRRLAGDNPASTQFRRDLATSHNSLGVLLSEAGKPSEAEAEFRAALAIDRKLAGDNPDVPDFANSLANSLTNTATVLLRLGRTAEARSLSERSVTLREALVRDQPEVPQYRNGLSESLLRSGLARRSEGDSAGAAADWRRAIALFKAASNLYGENLIYYAGCHASLAGIAGQSGTPGSAVEGDAEAARAMDLLRRAVGMGYTNLQLYRAETALDPLRDRPDFRLLMMDLAMPADPFAP